MTLQLRDVWKSFGSTAVLRGLSLDLRPGEVYALLGSNGSGKSTALKVGVGLLAPDRGALRIGEGTEDAEGRARLGFVPQEAALYPRLTCAETLRFFGRIHGVRGRSLRSRVEEVLDGTGLAPRRDQRVETLSGGWRQRVSVAAALVHDPEVLVMDEPTTGLDVRVQDELWGVIRSTAERGSAVLLSTHEIDQADTRADRVGILHEGRLVAEDSPEALRAGLGLAAIGEVEAEDGDVVAAWARTRGATAVPVGERWTLMLREPIELARLAAELADARPRSLALRPVGLVDVFRRVTAPERRAPSASPLLPGVA